MVGCIVAVVAPGVVFLGAEGKSIQRLPPVWALVMAVYWAAPLLVAVPRLQGARAVGIMCVVYLVAEVVALASVYGNNSSTAGVGLVTIPAGFAVGAGCVVLLRRGATSLAARRRRD